MSEDNNVDDIFSMENIMKNVHFDVLSDEELEEFTEKIELSCSNSCWQ